MGLDNYLAVVTDQVFVKALTNTALFTIGSILGQFVIGMLLALFFHKNFPLNGVLRALFLLPWLLPLIVGSAAWRAVLEQDSGILNVTLENLGIIDAPIPWLTSPDVALVAVILVNIWLGIPFNLTLLYSGLQDIPDELYEAGALDGATGWKAFWNITWPNLRAVVERRADAGRDLHPEGPRHHPRPDPGRPGQRHPDHRTACPTSARSWSSSSARAPP